MIQSSQYPLPQYAPMLINGPNIPQMVQIQQNNPQIQQQQIQQQLCFQNSNQFMNDQKQNSCTCKMPPNNIPNMGMSQIQYPVYPQFGIQMKQNPIYQEQVKTENTNNKIQDQQYYQLQQNLKNQQKIPSNKIKQKNLQAQQKLKRKLSQIPKNDDDTQLYQDQQLKKMKLNPVKLEQTNSETQENSYSSSADQQQQEMNYGFQQQNSFQQQQNQIRISFFNMENDYDLFDNEENDWEWLEEYQNNYLILQQYFGKEQFQQQQQQVQLIDYLTIYYPNFLKLRNKQDEQKLEKKVYKVISKQDFKLQKSMLQEKNMSKFHNKKKVFLNDIIYFFKDQNLSKLDIPQQLKEKIIQVMFVVKELSKNKDKRKSDQYNKFHYNALFLNLTPNTISQLIKENSNIELHKQIFGIDLNLQYNKIQLDQINFIKHCIYQIIVYHLKDGMMGDIEMQYDEREYEYRAFTGLAQMVEGKIVDRF